MSVEKLVEELSGLEDPRCAGKVDHRGGEGVGTVLPATPRASRSSMPSTTVMAAWSAGACSSTRRLPT